MAGRRETNLTDAIQKPKSLLLKTDFPTELKREEEIVTESTLVADFNFCSTLAQMTKYPVLRGLLFVPGDLY